MAEEQLTKRHLTTPREEKFESDYKCNSNGLAAGDKRTDFSLECMLNEDYRLQIARLERPRGGR